MTSPCAPLDFRLSIAPSTLSPSAAPILTSSKSYFFAASSANFHSNWNHGSSGCLTTNPSFNLLELPPLDPDVPLCELSLLHPTNNPASNARHEIAANLK